MATSVEEGATGGAGPQRRRVADPFGGAFWIAPLALLAVLAGFWNTFFTRLPQTDLAHMLHGWTWTAWLVLVPLQAWLVRARKLRWHRVAGWSSLALFALLVGTSWHMMALILSGQTGVPLEFAKLFVWSDIEMLPLFALAYLGAIWWRRDRHIHSRLMAITLLAGLLPALARMFNLMIPGPAGLVLAMHPSFLFILIVLAIAMWRDWRAGRLRWPFPVAFAWTATAYALLFPVWRSQWFDGVARWIGSTV